MAQALDLIEPLVTALARIDGLHCATSEAGWLTSKEAAYFRPSSPLLMARHFDLTAALLVRDPTLGTLGIVEAVAGESFEQVAAQVRQHVDTAAYARHLLLRDPKLGNALANTVELVLVAPGAGETRTHIGATLRELLRGTESMFHVGIGLLVHEGGDDPYRCGLRRAFPWLLTATRNWLDSGYGRQRQHNAARRLERIKLTHYRLSGERSVELARSRVHLLHGANGSGKSSLVEALELATVGRVDRLDRHHRMSALVDPKQPDAKTAAYLAVIRNRGGDLEPRVELGWDSGEPTTWPRAAESATTNGRLHASSFRLDQPLMERLVASKPDERAQCFLEAFFPEANDTLATYGAATAARDKARAEVKPTADLLISARQVLGRVAPWRKGSNAGTQAHYPERLNRWLELSVLADLARREHGVRATLAAARAASWDAGQEPEAQLLAPGDVDLGALAAAMEKWTKQAADLRDALGSAQPATPRERDAAGRVGVVLPHEREILNRAGLWLFEPHVVGVKTFGDKVFDVMTGKDTATTYGPIAIGSGDWAGSVQSTLQQLIDACEGMASGNPPEKWPGTTPCGAYEEAAKQHVAVAHAAGELNTRFLSVLSKGRADDATVDEFDGTLVSALNELMALFTPARWSYEDIRLPSELRGSTFDMTIALGAGADQAHAELHLNTAELNLFTVSLFLLCAGRVEKPLKLLVMDDPLQNMDELTSTALARGLTKLVRLWEALKRDDELLLLFHGYDDLERFQTELPAAVYRLPWLSPARETGKPIEIGAATGARSLAAQDFAPVFTRPQRL